MLPSLRPLIAESMEALAGVTAKTVPARHMYAGAETLHWCDEREQANDDAQCRVDEDLLEDYEDTLSKLSEAVDNWMQSKMARPAAFRDELNKILDIASRPR